MNNHGNHGNNGLHKHQLQEWDESVDLEELLQNTHSLLRLGRPFTQLLQTLDRLRRWEPWSACLVVLGITNSACIVLDGVYVVFSVLLILCLAGVGYVHRQTNLLAKFIPSLDNELPRAMTDSTPNSESQRDLAQSELLEEFRFLLCFMNVTIRTLSQYIIKFYAILKWENFNHSLRCYTFVTVITVLLHVIPARWSLAVCVNVFFLHYPFQQYFVVIKDMHGSVRRQESVEEAMYNCYPSPIGGFSDNDRYIQQCASEEDPLDHKGAAQYATEDNDTGEKSEGGSSSDEAIELKFGTSNMALSSTTEPGTLGKGKRPGMVGKLLKTVKNQSGSCAGCSVNFTTILKRRRLCSHCGNHFCARCCSYKVTRAMFGATAPAAQTETVSVCFYCFNYLNKIYRSRGGSKTSLNSVGTGGSKQNGNSNGSRRTKSDGNTVVCEVNKQDKEKAL